MTTVEPEWETVGARPTPPPDVLRGPTHAENYRVRVGRYRDRWYTDPLPADGQWTATPDVESYPSVSIVKKASGNDWSFVALKRAARRPDELAVIAAASEFDERYEKLKLINKLGLDADSRRGTNVHTWAEHLAYGAPIPHDLMSPDAPGAAFLPVVDRLWADLQPRLVAAELVCIHRSLNGFGYGGTTDGIFEIDGELYIVDWKSRGSEHDCYPEEAAQLGAYSHAEYAIVSDETSKYGARRAEMPKLAGGLIVSIATDSYEVYPIDLAAGFEHFAALHSWWIARRSERKPIGRKWAPRRAVSPLGLPTPEHPGTVVGAPSPMSAPDEQRKEGLYARHAKLDDEQKERFGEQVVTIDTNDLDQVEALLDRIGNPPPILPQINERQAAEPEPDRDSRLSAEGGKANADDIRVFEARWELGLNKPGKAWVGDVVREAIDAKCDFRYSQLASQRRVDIYCALTEWATTDVFDKNNDEPFRAVLNTIEARDTDDVASDSLGFLLGTLTTAQAKALRSTITQIAANDMQLSYGPDVAPRWVPTTDNTTSESNN